jgi:hypothetical protein
MAAPPWCAASSSRSVPRKECSSCSCWALQAVPAPPALGGEQPPSGDASSPDAIAAARGLMFAGAAGGERACMTTQLWVACGAGARHTRARARACAPQSQPTRFASRCREQLQRRACCSEPRRVRAAFTFLLEQANLATPRSAALAPQQRTPRARASTPARCVARSGAAAHARSPGTGAGGSVCSKEVSCPSKAAGLPSNA